jgi:hypothetical protein
VDHTHGLFGILSIALFDRMHASLSLSRAIVPPKRE